MRVDGDETVETSAGSPVEARAAQTRQRDDTVGLDLALRDEPQLPVDEVGRIGRRHELDPVFLEQLADRLAAGSSEELERLLLGRDERELDALDLMGTEMAGGHQGELVERQRPDGTRGNDEGDSPYLARRDLREEATDLVGVGWAAEGECARDGRGRNGADGDEQEVVGRSSRPRSSPRGGRRRRLGAHRE